MSNTTDSSIKNSINTFNFIAYTFLLILFSVLGMVVVFQGNPRGYLGVFLGILCFTPFAIMEVIRKPKSISFTSEGIYLVFRFNSSIEPALEIEIYRFFGARLTISEC